MVVTTNVPIGVVVPRDELLVTFPGEVRVPVWFGVRAKAKKSAG